MEIHPFPALFLHLAACLPLFSLPSLRGRNLAPPADMLLHVLGLVQNSYQSHKFFFRQCIIVNLKLRQECSYYFFLLTPFTIECLFQLTYCFLCR